MSEIRWALDSLVIRGNAVFGFGWAFHRSQKISGLRLKLLAPNKQVLGCISADSGKPREDIERSFPGHKTALNSGFVFLGAAAALTELASVVLECSLADGTVIEIKVPQSAVLRVEGELGAGRLLMLRQSWVFFKRGLNLVRTGNFASLFEKAKRYLKGRPRMSMHKPSDLAEMLKSDPYEGLSLILDHDLGGGANQYREKLVESISREGRTSVILTYHVATLTHMLIVRNSRMNERYAIPNAAFVLAAFESLPLKEIIYNTAVSFTEPEGIPQLLTALKARTRAHLRVLLHDYFAVCPSHFLLDQHGSFCRIPDASVCAECLPNNKQGFSTLFSGREIQEWRSAWSALFATADEIVAFSRSTVSLVQRAYPAIRTDRISVRPHKVERPATTSVQVKNAERPCIGVVGMIGYHKGARIVEALAAEIKARALGLKIVVIGSIEASCDKDVVSQTGPYKHEELPQLIERSGANVMLFPSICPETFSYVVQELMDLGLPVASFDFGAPAERLSSYAKGAVLSSMDPARMLDELISFHRKIYLAD